MLIAFVNSCKVVTLTADTSQQSVKQTWLLLVVVVVLTVKQIIYNYMLVTKP